MKQGWLLLKELTQTGTSKINVPESENLLFGLLQKYWTGKNIGKLP